MNNPYRARPGRPRVEHKAPAAVQNYGVQNQNWPTMAPVTQPTSNIYHTQQQPTMNQPKQMTDSWDWGENGNDAWNWSIDQSVEQQSQTQIPQQQPQFVPNYQNRRPSQQQLTQDNFYSNINGNNRPLPPAQHQLSGGNSPRTAPSRESTPSQSDSYPQHQNYGLNQQQQQQQQQISSSRPSSNKSNSSLNDSHNSQPQWPTSQPTLERQDSAHFAHNANQYFQSSAPGAFDITSQTSHQPQQFGTNNYNWNGVEQTQNPSGHNWQNQIQEPVSGYWPDLKKEEAPKAVDNQWSVQQSQTQTPQHTNNTSAPEVTSLNWQGDHVESDQSRKPSLDTVQTNQWHEEPISLPDQRKQSLNANHQHPTMLNSYAQHDNSNLPQSWQHTSLQQPQLNQWQDKIPEVPNKIPENNSINSLEDKRNSNQNWLHMEAPVVQYPSSVPQSTTVVSTPNTVTIAPNQEQNIPPLFSSVENSVQPKAVPEVETSLLTSQITDNRSRNEMTVENLDRSQVKETPFTGWSIETDSRHSDSSVSELSANVSQLNLGENSQKNFEAQRLPYTTQSSMMDQWPMYTSAPQTPDHPPMPIQTTAQSFTHAQDHSPPTTLVVAHEVPVIHPQESTGLEQPMSARQPPPSRHQEFSAMHVNPVTPPVMHPYDYQPQQSTAKYPTALETTVDPTSIQEPKQPVNVVESPKIAQTAVPSENISQTGYDQWYNQTATRPQRGSWQPNADRNVPPKLWQPTVEPATENFEVTQSLSDSTNLEFGSPHDRESHERDSVVKEIPSNEAKLPTPPKETSVLRNIEQTSTPQQSQQSPHIEQPPENYEFASNDRNTFLETGELTDSHHEHELTPPSQDDENDEVPSEIPFLREVPGQSSSADPRRNDPTGQEQYVQSSPRILDPRRNDPSGQAQMPQNRSLPLAERSERRDVPSGQERRESVPLLTRDPETLERRNDPSGREQSLPPTQSRNDPSGEERIQPQSQILLEPNEVREVPGSGLNSTPSVVAVDSGLRQIPGGVSPEGATTNPDDRNNTRVVTGSQEVPPVNAVNDSGTETRTKREEAVGSSIRGDPLPVTSSPKRRDSYEDGDDEESGNSRDETRDRRRGDTSPTDRRRYDYERKGDRSYYDRDREYDEDYYYDRRRGPDYERAYNSREDLDRRDASFREGDRRHTSRDDLDDRRPRLKEEDERDGRRRGVDDRRGLRGDDPRRRDRDGREFDGRYSRDARDRDYAERDRRREERRRRYDDYDPRDPRREYYDDPYARGSRPSSRSSYNDREYYMRSRDPYYGYNNGYGAYDAYGTNYSANYYAYLENLRRTNPTAYMEWYNKYYASQQQQQPVPRGQIYPEDRASVHSGRSSCEERTTSGKQTIGDISLLEDSRIPSRMTPTKFSTSHVKGSFSIGSLLHVHASYPADGERARIDILRVENLLQHDPVARELRAYPGPLIKGVTHKKTIIEYCEAKIKKATVNDELIDRASYILLYQLMIMLIQQNGNVVGVDIAALLLRNKDAYSYDANKLNHMPGRRESTISQRSGGAGKEGSVNENNSPQEIEDIKPQKTVEQITTEFRNTLLYGLVQEALEYAMNEGLWGHALFLASKLDKRTHASVMTRFANSLPAQDPLQTLYQLHSGRVPASVTCVADIKWDDWRPHLAMIISNTSANPEINRRSITTLGDTLAARGDIHAAHFCYILAQIEFGVYGTSGVKMVLIGANHHKIYSEFASSEAVMLTEIYEYARNLSEPGFTLIGLQTFKLETAQKMVDYGLIEKSLLYLEQIAINIINEPSKYKQSFIHDVYTLSERIKFHDPVFKDCTEDDTSLAWLNNLGEIVGRCQAGEIIQDIGNSRIDHQNLPHEQEQQQQQQQQQHQQQQQQQQTQQQWNYTVANQQDYSTGPLSMMELPSVEASQDQWQPLSLPTTIQDPYTVEQTPQYPGQTIEGHQYQQQQQQQQQQEYWGQPSYNQQDYSRDYGAADWKQQQNNQMQYQQEQTDVDSSQQQGGWNYEPQPQISMGPSSGKQYDPLEELDALEQPNEVSKSSGEIKKSQDKQPEKKATNAGGGSWFGGLFSKLTPKPKNQMILPDDNNPTIVWDPVAKKWTNKDEDGENGPTRLAPPPKASDLGLKPPTDISQASIPEQPSMPTRDDTSTPNSSKMISGSNMFKLQKGRGMRSNYIDVMNPGGIKSNGPPSIVPTPANSPLMPMAASSPQLFIPTPINDPNAPVDFLTPTPTTIPSSETTSQGGPMMYNPTDMKDNSAKNVSRNRYPPR